MSKQVQYGPTPRQLAAWQLVYMVLAVAAAAELAIGSASTALGLGLESLVMLLMDR